MVRRIERLHAITEELRRRSPSYVSADALAARMDVSRRTIERDLESLRLAGVPTYGQPGRSGGTAITGAGPSRPVSLSNAEIVSLVVAVHLSATGPFAVAGRTAIDKLLDSIDDSQKVVVEQIRSRFRIAPNSQVLKPRVMSVLEDAVRIQHVVKITYLDRNGEQTRRTVDPVGFYRDENRWSLIGWCHLRHAGRLFILDRVQRADATSIAAEPHDVDQVLGWVPKLGSRV